MKQLEADIEEAVENLKQCMIKESILSLKENTLKAEKVKAHNDTLLAKQEVNALYLK